MIKTRPRIAGMILCAALFLGLSRQAAAEKVPQWELGAGVAGLDAARLPRSRTRSAATSCPFPTSFTAWSGSRPTGPAFTRYC